MLLFGSEGTNRFPNQTEAATNMVSVSVPVWQVSNGTKVSSSLTLSVHKALAQEVQAIFTEIYHDPDRFPIHDVGGDARSQSSDISEGYHDYMHFSYMGN